MHSKSRKKDLTKHQDRRILIGRSVLYY